MAINNLSRLFDSMRGHLEELVPALAVLGCFAAFGPLTLSVQIIVKRILLVGLAISHRQPESIS
jgi:hypothetical protein